MKDNNKYQIVKKSITDYPISELGKLDIETGYLLLTECFIDSSTKKSKFRNWRFDLRTGKLLSTKVKILYQGKLVFK